MLRKKKTQVNLKWKKFSVTLMSMSLKKKMIIIFIRIKVHRGKYFRLSILLNAINPQI